MRSGRGTLILPLGSRLGRKLTLWASGRGQSLREGGLGRGAGGNRCARVGFAEALQDPWGEGGRRRLRPGVGGNPEPAGPSLLPPVLRPLLPVQGLDPRTVAACLPRTGGGSCRRRGGGARREGAPSLVSPTPTLLLARGVGRRAPLLRRGRGAQTKGACAFKAGSPGAAGRGLLDPG